MSWTSDDQTAAEQAAYDFATQYSRAVGSWKLALETGGNAVAAQGNVSDIVNKWRSSVNNLENKSDVIMSDQTVMDKLGVIATQVADERAILAKLRNEAGTRSNQADSVNPKIRTSPYTNILGLRRTFRESTRMAILIASIIFGVLALVALGYLGFATSGPAIATITSTLGLAGGPGSSGPGPGASGSISSGAFPPGPRRAL